MFKTTIGISHSASYEKEHVTNCLVEWAWSLRGKNGGRWVGQELPRKRGDQAPKDLTWANQALPWGSIQLLCLLRSVCSWHLHF